MSVRPLISPRVADALAEARVHLAAAYRLAVLHELEEGIDNHFTMTVPGHRRPVPDPALRPALVGGARQRPDRLRRRGSRARGRQESLELLGAFDPCADPPHHRRARRPAHASDLGHGPQHAAGQPRDIGEPDRRLLPRPDRLRRRLLRHGRDPGRGRAPGGSDGRQAGRLHEEPRRARDRRDDGPGLPKAVSARARLPQPGPRAEHRPAAGGACRTRSPPGSRRRTPTTAIRGANASASSSRRCCACSTASCRATRE